MEYEQHDDGQDPVATLSPTEFLGYIEFLAEHDLFDDVRRALAKSDVTAIRINSAPLALVKGMIDELLTGDRFTTPGRARATQIVEECGCSGCGGSCSTDAGTEAGTSDAGTPGPSPTLPMEPGSSVHVP